MKNIKKIIIGFCCAIINYAAFAIPNVEGIQQYQKNMHLSEERVQSLANDIDRYHNADNIWDVLREEFTLPHYEDNPLVQEQIQWFLTHRDFLLHSTARAAPYLYYILQQTRKRHLPAEVVLLPMMESAYNPLAYSSAGAAGIWQLMPGTAHGYGIKQNWWYDGRRDVIASTKAALDYLAYLGSFFEGNWLLAIAAYDTGEGNVLSAIKKNYYYGANTDFWSLPVAQETREYVPRLLALAAIISHPERYYFQFPSVRNAPYLGQVDIGRRLDLRQAANLAGISFERLKQLNSGHNRSSMGPNGPYKLVLPIENVQQFSENLSRARLNQPVQIARYKIRPGDTVKIIAKKFNVSPGALRKANPMLAFGAKPGKSIIIPNQEKDLTEQLLEAEQPVVASNENYKPVVRQTKTSLRVARQLEKIQSHSNYTLQPGDTLYMVRKNDDLQKISRHFHTTPEILMAANNLGNTHIKPGEKLIIPTHLNNSLSENNVSLTPGDTIYMVRKGDTIDKIAHKFHTSPSNIRLSNLLASNDVQEGDRLVIPTHG